MRDRRSFAKHTNRVATTLDRYSVVLVVVAVVVTATRLTGGGFFTDHDRGAAAAAPTRVAPFRPAAEVQPAVPSPVRPGGVALPAFDSGFAVEEAPSASPTTTTTTQPPAEEEPGAFGEVYDVAAVPPPGAATAPAVAPGGDIWVGTDNGDGRGDDGPPKLFVFPRDGSPVGTYSIEGVDAGITALQFDGAGVLYAAARSPAAVFAFDTATGLARTYAAIPDVLPCVPRARTSNCDGAVVDARPQPSALAFDATGNLFVGDAGQGAIWRVARDGTVAQWIVRSEWTHPVRRSGPSGLAFDGAGNLVVAVRSAFLSDVGVVAIVAVAADGTAGALTELKRTEEGAAPAGLALGMSGKVYLTLSGPGAGRVLVLDPKGEEVGRTPSISLPPLDTPAGIAFRGDSLIVAAQAPTLPLESRIVRLPVGERGGRTPT